MNRDLIEHSIELLIEALGYDIGDPNFSDTPKRVADSYREIFAGVEGVDQQIEEILSTSFPCSHQQMIVARKIEVYGMCPHHFLPVHYMITVGYMPSDDGRVLGLSKLARIAHVFAARPVLQEQIVNDVTAALMRLPGCRGAGCIAHGEHYCMRMRGVKQSGSVVVTSSLEGEFRDNAMVRSEFMSLYKD